MTVPASLAHEIADGVVERLRARGLSSVPTVPEVEAVLSPALEGAPFATRSMPPGALSDLFASAVPDAEDALAALRARHLVDLLLARACAIGDGEALSRFEGLYADDLRRAHARQRAAASYDDFVQTLREKLFSGDGPSIAGYTGAGELRAWVRVTATRTLVDLGRRPENRERPTDDVALEVPAPSDDPELGYLKAHYRDAVKAALAQAARDLSPAERNLLRQHYTGGLGIDQLAALSGVHRATAARRLAQARERLLAGTRACLMARAHLAEGELLSVLRLVESQLHVTLDRLLRE